MAAVTLSVGGYQIEFSLPDGLSISKSHYRDFAVPVRTSNESIQIQVFREDIPESCLRNWNEPSLLMDSSSTWAMARGTKAPWAYHLGPSPTQTSDPPTFHMLFDSEFQKGALYLGKNYRKKKIPSGDIYPLDEVLVRHLLAKDGGLHLHAAGVEINNRGYLFLGDSGAGKSTIASFFCDRLGKDLVYSDDRIIIRKPDNEWIMYGSPWHGTLKSTKAASLKLGGFCFIEQSKQNRIIRLSKEDAFLKLAQVYLGVWWLPEFRQTQLETLERIVADPSQQFFTVQFDLTGNIVELFKNEISK